MKHFESDALTKTKRPFSGVVCKELFIKGEAYFKVRYDDGDIEDITMEELATIMVQEEATTTVEEGSKEKIQGVRKRTRKSKSSKGDMGKDNNNGNDKLTAEEKDKEISSPPPPPWDYMCV